MTLSLDFPSESPFLKVLILSSFLTTFFEAVSAKDFATVNKILVPGVSLINLFASVSDVTPK